MEKIDSLDRQILELYPKMPASRLKMSQQNVEFHAQPFISVCKD